MRLLIINPNSSALVTDHLRSILSPPPGVSLTFYTAPESAPKEITATNGRVSAEIVYSDLCNTTLDYDGFLVCCFSNHPLVNMLSTRGITLGIMHASLFLSLSLPGNCNIITSTTDWEPVLDDDIKLILGSKDRDLKLILNGTDLILDNDLIQGSNNITSKFSPTASLNTNVLNLQQCYSSLHSKVRESNADIIILGCANLSGFDKKLNREFDKVCIDPVVTGLELLVKMVNGKKVNAEKK